jgi:hypothetical protein
MKIVGASTGGGASGTKQPSPIWLNKKTHVFERACIVANKGAKRTIFEGNMPPKKMYPPYWRRYRRHNRNPVKYIERHVSLKDVVSWLKGGKRSHF